MNQAIDNRALRIDRRKAILILVLAAGIAFAFKSLEFVRGPYVCDTDCGVASPLPDIATVQHIKNSRGLIDRLPIFAWASGTTYLICNATHCATYRQTFSGRYVTDRRTPITPSPEADEIQWIRLGPSGM